MHRLLAILCIAALWSSDANSQRPATLNDLLRSDYKYQPPESSCDIKLCVIYLNGPITVDLLNRVHTLIAKRDPMGVVQVYIDSPGGDLDAAIRLGRLFRESAPVIATVFPGAVCASACVLTLVGATTRNIGGKVAIHRPYTVDSTNRTYADLQIQFTAIDDLARKYLGQMNIPPTLYDEMLRYPPESVRILSKSELDQYRISGSDYVWEETTQRRHAQHLGIDRQTYVQRLGIAARACVTPSIQDAKESVEQWANRLVASSECRNRVLRTGR